ncbi:hypothetical protein BC941DRAFT_502789 [Chlamydoabsidia padenii]|nr:hypothetical protein BC941DRAFT_502789 [Chlamydoabsidia padenii]
MPSRHNRKAKVAVNTYNEKKIQKAPPRTKNLQQSTPAITVTDASPPEDILHSSWKLLYIFQFLTLFRQHLNLPAISLDHLESLLLSQNYEINKGGDTASQPQDQTVDDHGNKNSTYFSSRESSVVDGSIEQQERSLAKLIVPIMISLYNDKKRKPINDSNYPHYIYNYLYNHSVEEDIQEILGRYPDSIPFSRLALLDKIAILKELVDSVFETGAALEWKNTLPPEDMRAFPMGKDSEGWSYWIFGDSRLYREMAISPRKKETDYTFQLLATTTTEWTTWMTKFSNKSSKPAERALASNLHEYGTMMVQKMEAKEAAKLRENAKMERAKQLDMLPRKRSRRIEVKSEIEEKRRQLEELEQAQWEYEEAQRELERKQQEDQAERDKQAMQIEEARLKEDVYQALDRKIIETRQLEHLQSDTTTTNAIDDGNDGDGNWIKRLKYLRTKLKKSASYEDVVDKATGWATLLDGDYKVVATPLNFLSATNQEEEDELIDVGEPLKAPVETSNIIVYGNVSPPPPSENQQPVSEHLLSAPSGTATPQTIDCKEISTSNKDVAAEDTLKSTTSVTPLAKSDSDRPPTTDTTEISSLSQPFTATGSTTLDSITSSEDTTTTSNTINPSIVKRGRPRKIKQPVVDIKVLPSFTDALNFTGNGVKSDLKDPLLKLIICTLISQARQHPIIADAELRHAKKSGKKRKATLVTAPMDLYTIHKKLLLGQYNTETTENGSGLTTNGPESNQILTDGLSAFEYWLKDMDALPNKGDPM